MGKTSVVFPNSGFDGDLKCEKPDKMPTISIRYIGNQKNSQQAFLQMVDSESFFKMSRCAGKRADVAPIAAVTSFFDTDISPYGINAGLS
ncbi:MAG: hypothetical protein IJ911_13580 [Salinivirgaceae bacterium]|nr:hypothetical protein [Salinivirgaceae bacterium]